MTSTSETALLGPQPDMLHVALFWAKLGLRVFPILPNSKTPAIPAWNQRASYDPEKVRAMWTTYDPVNEVERIRNYNVGIACGRTRDGFVAVVDVDIKNGARGRDTLDELDLTAPGTWLDTRHVRTCSGGDHFYFMTDVPLANTASKLGPGLDTRGEGGFVVAPGSIIDGKAYEDLGGAFRAAPSWLVQAIGAAPDRYSEGAEVLCLLDTPPAIERATAYLLGADPAIEGLGGNSHTLRTAARVKDFGLSQQGCLALMFERWNPRCVPPWEWEELAVVVGNAYKYGQNGIGIANPEADFDPVEPDDPLRQIPGKVEPVTPNKLGDFVWEHCDSMRPDLERRDLIKGVLLRVGTVGLVGPSNVGKSQAEAHLAYSIAAGEPWCGRRVLQGAVLCALGEGAEGFRGRVQAIMDVKGRRGIPFYMAPRVPNLLDPKSVEAFILSCHALAKKHGLEIRAIVIDTLTTATTGGDQNAIDSMSGVVGQSRRISVSLDCVVIIIHHTGKDETKGARGSTALIGDWETELRVEADGPKRFKISTPKQRDFEKDMVFSFVSKVAGIGKDLDGDDVTAVYAEWVDHGDEMEDFTPPGERKLTPQQQMVVDILKDFDGRCGREWLKSAFSDRWLAKSPNAKESSISSTFRRILTELGKYGVVNEVGQGTERAYMLRDLESLSK